MTRLILVRHGETTWNYDQRMQGQTDTDLSDFGRQQVLRLRERLAREEIAAAYSSDLRRCWDTATGALAGRDVPLSPMESLREVHLGDWQGHTYAELMETMPDEVRRVRANRADEAPRGGETHRQLQTRVAGAIREIATRHPDDQVLVVSHGGALRALACWALLADVSAQNRIDVDNCAVSRIDLLGDEARLRRWNDVGHLDGLIHPATGIPGVE
jgi:probable phosphoglycerate mutase